MKFEKFNQDVNTRQRKMKAVGELRGNRGFALFTNISSKFHVMSPVSRGLYTQILPSDLMRVPGLNNGVRKPS